MTSLTLVRRIGARPSIVFDALTTPEGIACWWGPDAGPVLVAETDLRVDGRYRVRFRMLDGSERECSGEYLQEAGTPYQERLIGPDDLATAAYRAPTVWPGPCHRDRRTQTVRVGRHCAAHRRKVRSADALRRELTGADQGVDVRRVELGRTSDPEPR
jgi:hypothetical protein